MTATCPETAKEILAELTALQSAVEETAGLIANGHQLDLTPLGVRVGLVCDAAVALPAAESRALLPPLEKLIESLDVLTERLDTAFGHLPKLHSEAEPKTATSAYGRTQDG